jgi:hypothetical protein
MKWHGLLIHFRADHGSTITLSISFVQINMAKTVLIDEVGQYSIARPDSSSSKRRYIQRMSSTLFFKKKYSTLYLIYNT